MLIILSPSKTINSELTHSVTDNSIPKFINKSTKIISKLSRLKPTDLEKLMKISVNLAQINYERFQVWNRNHDLTNSKQALLSFKGEVFTGLNANSFSEEDLLYSQNRMIILSGLYGILRPLDLIQPYRLEISTKLAIGNSRNLYDYWKDSITTELNNIITKNKITTLINLASLEYFKVVDKNKINANIVTPIFKEYKDNSYKNVTIYAKKARGLMSNFIIKNKIKNAADIKLFDKEGYYYNDALSKNNEIVFTRG